MRAGSSKGFTLIAALFWIAISALGLTAAGHIWSKSAQRERENDLIRIGTLYARAIASYQIASPGADKQFPASLDALLLDTRFVGTVRHLRKRYADPFIPGQPWGLVRNEAGRIVGVFSKSVDAPLVLSELRLEDRVMPQARQYSDWKFLAFPSP